MSSIFKVVDVAVLSWMLLILVALITIFLAISLPISSLPSTSLAVILISF